MRVLVRLTGDVCAQLAQAELAEKGWHEHQGMHGQQTVAIGNKSWEKCPIQHGWYSAQWELTGGRFRIPSAQAEDSWAE